MCSSVVNQITFSLEAERIEGRKISHFLRNEVEDEDRQKIIKIKSKLYLGKALWEDL